MRIWTQKSASIQKRTSPLKFDNFAEKSEKDTVSYLSTKAWSGRTAVDRASGSTSFDFPGVSVAASGRTDELLFQADLS